MQVIYKEQVSDALGCTDATALLMMKRTGYAFKVGRRYAIPSTVFEKLINGKISRIETPEDFLFMETR